jgi:protein-tyrosine phosphatase
MVDLHCHILPGLDDGAATMEESVAMAESAIADGITHVVATPHASSAHSFHFARARQLRDELQEKIGNRLKIATGCDFHLNPENLASLRRDARQYCINQRHFLLVEFNEFSIPPAMDQTLHAIQLAGVQPVITHPERNAILRSRPQRLKKWVQQGCFAQVTGGALTGTFGAGPRQDALRWIGQGLIHFVASDAHNTRGRPLRLQPAHKVVLDKFGPEKARALFEDNPLAAFEGRELPYVPEVRDESPLPRRKRFFFF